MTPAVRVVPVELPVGYLSAIASLISDDTHFNRPTTTRGIAMRVAHKNLMIAFQDVR